MMFAGKYNDGIPADSRLAHESVKWMKNQFEQGKAVNGLEVWHPFMTRERLRMLVADDELR